MRKLIQTVSLLLLGIGAIYGINRWVTRPVTAVGGESVTVESKQVQTFVENEPNLEATEKADTSDLPEGSIEDWNLFLIGPDSPMEEDFSEDLLTEIPGSVMQLDRRVIDSYEALSAAATDAGFPLAIVSAYRSVSYQEQVFADDVAVNRSQNMTEAEAVEKSKQTLTEPGHSEHHTGLAIDIVDEDWLNNYPQTMLDEAYGDEPGAKWLAEHAREYGFIVRYPKGKEDITKITYEPWHFRYVGVEHAKYIEEHQLTLEEYIDLLKEK